jgi:hypothetical protein
VAVYWLVIFIRRRIKIKKPQPGKIRLEAVTKNRKSRCLIKITAGIIIDVGEGP